MKAMQSTLRLAVLVLLLAGLGVKMPAQVPTADVQGAWTIYSTNIENGEVVVKHVQLVQSGNEISGHFDGPNQSGPIHGEVNQRHIVFSTVTRNVLTFRGQVYGDTMSGEYGLHGKHAQWQGVRDSATSSFSPPTGTVYSSQPIIETEPPAPVAAPQPPPQPAPVVMTQPAGQPAASVPTSNGAAPVPVQLTADQLNALVAPIALYPDALVAQVLAASTNPDQISEAAQWLSQNSNLTGTALAQAVDQQSWDPSVKALIQFPSVLDNLANNLSWTSSLGQAFANQQPDVMAAVQAMRAKAQAAGTLQSNSQVTVTQPAASTIVIQPANPQVVYVPQYNPAVVYGAPVAVPLYVAPPVPVTSVGVFFGSGITVGASFGGGGWGAGFGWGWHAWNVNWGGWGGGGSTVIYNNNTYINNRTWNNTNYNGYHPWGPHSDPNYRPGTDTHYGPNGAYHPNGYYGPNGGWHPTGPVNHAGGATGSENTAYYGNNGAYHPTAGYHPGTDTHYGPNGAYHPNQYYGPGGGLHPDKPGTNPADQPNGGNNGNHGLIGGNGGVQHPVVADNHQPTNRLAGEQNRSRFSGNGAANRAESNRGRSSMAHRQPQHVSHPVHAPAEHHPSGGGGRRR